MRFTPEQPIFGLSAPSAAGKTWLAKQLIQHEVVNGWPSHTTRPRRAGETSTTYDHIFVDNMQFADIKQQGRFAIAASIYGHHYGLTMPPSLNRPAFVLLKPQVIESFVTFFGPRAVVFGMHAENGAALAEELMRERAQDQADIERRLAIYEQEIAMNEALIPETNYFVTSGHPCEVLPAITAEIMKRV
jgi:guanylate kinase